MRIAVVNWSRRRVAGAESYITAAAGELSRGCHHLALWTESAGPADRPPIPMPPDAPVWIAAELGRERAIADLKSWRPDILFFHGLSDPAVEECLRAIAPGVLVFHNYYGTCVSGMKMFSFPVRRPCRRRFGLGCLACYFPRRCGGLNPVTAVRHYRVAARRLQQLRRHSGVVVFSSAMHAECLRHGVAGDRLHHVPPLLTGEGGGCRLPLADAAFSGESWELLYVGRMDAMKGGPVLMSALRTLPARLGRPVRLTLAGEGPDRRKWERLAGRAATAGLQIRFEGWVTGDRLDDLYRRSHLLLVPSQWPEPFGLIGPEAGLFGVPAAAFAVGGIRDWLHDGVNGRVAPAAPPTASGFADAIVGCLSDATGYQKLRAGARQLARRYTDAAAHLARLNWIFEQVAAGAAS
ncbi:MAG: glycosyltransferase [Gemmataceae bacterium]